MRVAANLPARPGLILLQEVAVAPEHGLLGAYNWFSPRYSARTTGNAIAARRDCINKYGFKILDAEPHGIRGAIKTSRCMRDI